MIQDIIDKIAKNPNKLNSSLRTAMFITFSEIAIPGNAIENALKDALKDVNNATFLLKELRL